MTTRQEKINSLLQREIGSYILSEGFEGITGLLTITKVRVTADLEQAKVFFSVVGQDANMVLEILKKHIYQIQGRVNSRLQMKKLPRVTFVVDPGSEHASRIDKLIKDLRNQ